MLQKCYSDNIAFSGSYIDIGDGCWWRMFMTIYVTKITVTFMIRQSYDFNMNFIQLLTKEITIFVYP